MKRFGVRPLGFALMVGVAAILPMIAGCQTLRDPDADVNAARVDHTMATNWYQIGDDTEMLLLLDRPVKFSVVPVPSN